MLLKSKKITGRINSKAEMFFHEKDHFKKFLQDNKESQIIFHVEVLDKDPSRSLIGYYYAKIVPDCVEAHREKGNYILEAKCEQELREACPFMHEETVDYKTGVYTSRLKSVPELTHKELIEYFSFVRMWAHENLHLYIKDPLTFD